MTDYGTSGLGSAGRDVGGMMSGIAPGAGGLLLTVKLADTVGDITHEVGKGIKGKGRKKKRMKHKLKVKK